MAHTAASLLHPQSRWSREKCLLFLGRKKVILKPREIRSTQPSLVYQIGRIYRRSVFLKRRKLGPLLHHHSRISPTLLGRRHSDLIITLIVLQMFIRILYSQNRIRYQSIDLKSLD